MQKQNYVFTEVEMLSPKVLQAELKELPQQLHTRLDYGNFVLVGLPAYQQRHLESVLNAARLVWFIDCVVITTSRTPLQHCIGCVCQNVSISTCQCCTV